MNDSTGHAEIGRLPDLVKEMCRLPNIEAHDRILEGLPLQEVLSTVADLHLKTATIAALLGVRPRTITRWKRTNKQTLSPVHGSRIYRLMRILQEGVEIFGSSQAIVDWLQKNQQALAFSRPLDLMTTDAGATCVQELLTRIRYNVYT